MAKRYEKTTGTRLLVLSALFLAVGVVLPSLTGSIKEIGDSLLPMHLVVMLCGIVCGWKRALPVGLAMPFLRSLLFSMPPLYPNAVWMALELATYGAVIGALYALRRHYSRLYLLLCLVCAMIAGRIVWGITKAVLLGFANKPFGWQAFVVGGFLDAFPGILLQFILIPAIVELLHRARAKHAR